MTYDIDLNLELDLDDYLLSHETFKFVKLLFDEYNKRHPNKINYHNLLFKNKYPLLDSFYSLVSLKRTLDDNELFFLANLIYKEKGSIESIKMVLDIVNCEYSVNIQNGKLSLVIHYIDVTNVYLANINLIKLCKDLLFFYSYEFEVEEINVVYKLIGEVNKSYATYTTYNFNDAQLVEKETQIINFSDDW